MNDKDDNDLNKEAADPSLSQSVNDYPLQQFLENFIPTEPQSEIVTLNTHDLLARVNKVQSSKSKAKQPSTLENTVKASKKKPIKGSLHQSK